MDNQYENNRQDEDNIADKNTDVTRSENRQGVADSEGLSAANGNAEGRDSNDGERNRNTGMAGSHKEGQYSQQSDKPTMDPGHTDQ